jgi:hypothetical protein
VRRIRKQSDRSQRRWSYPIGNKQAASSNLAFVGTLWMGRIRYEPPMLFAVGFILLFMMGGLSGV